MTVILSTWTDFIRCIRMSATKATKELEQLVKVIKNGVCLW